MRLDELRAAMHRQIDAQDPAAEMQSQGLSAHEAGLVAGSKAFRAVRSAKGSAQVGRARRKYNAAKGRGSAA
jgi:hypothetical protein